MTDILLYHLVGKLSPENLQAVWDALSDAASAEFSHYHDAKDLDEREYHRLRWHTLQDGADYLYRCIPKDTCLTTN